MPDLREISNRRSQSEKKKSEYVIDSGLFLLAIKGGVKKKTEGKTSD